MGGRHVLVPVDAVTRIREPHERHGRGPVSTVRRPFRAVCDAYGAIGPQGLDGCRIPGYVDLLSKRGAQLGADFVGYPGALTAPTPAGSAPPLLAKHVSVPSPIGP
jgi:hypothetical protein